MAVIFLLSGGHYAAPPPPLERRQHHLISVRVIRYLFYVISVYQVLDAYISTTLVPAPTVYHIKFEIMTGICSGKAAQSWLSDVIQFVKHFSCVKFIIHMHLTMARVLFVLVISLRLHCLPVVAPQIQLVRTHSGRYEIEHLLTHSLTYLLFIMNYTFAVTYVTCCRLT